MMAEILVVEDDVNISDILKITLSDAGHKCMQAFDGEQAANYIEEKDYDLIILDIMLPIYDGYTLLDYIKPTGMPVIFLTAKASVSDKVKGLKMGADDYLVKPFEPEELLARVEAVLRRSGKMQTVLQAHNVIVDLEAHTVTQSGEKIFLTTHEYDLLCVFMKNQGVALYRNALFEQVWQKDSEDGGRTLDIHVMRLRKKLGWQNEITTVYKIGYLLEN